MLEVIMGGIIALDLARDVLAKRFTTCQLFVLLRVACELAEEEGVTLAPVWRKALRLVGRDYSDDKISEEFCRELLSNLICQAAPMNVITLLSASAVSPAMYLRCVSKICGTCRIMEARYKETKTRFQQLMLNQN
jgi:hypothetical protein